MKILCVEDGSIDIDALKKEPLRDGKVLVYRQGSKPPFILEIPNEPKAITEKCSSVIVNLIVMVLVLKFLNIIMNMLLKE